MRVELRPQVITFLNDRETVTVLTVCQILCLAPGRYLAASASNQISAPEEKSVPLPPTLALADRQSAAARKNDPQRLEFCLHKHVQISG